MVAIKTDTTASSKTSLEVQKSPENVKLENDGEADLDESEKNNNSDCRAQLKHAELSNIMNY